MKHKLIYLFLLAAAFACEGPEGPAGPAGTNGTNGTNGNNGHNSLVTLTDVEAGDENCAAGGVKIDTGIDANDNGTLDAGEIQVTQHVCHGTGGSGPKELKFPLGVFGAGEDLVVNVLYEGFDAENFEAYDSIVLVIKDVTVTPEGGGDPVDDQNIVFEFVDASNDDAPLAGSQFNVQTGVEFVSPNIADVLPLGKFDLGFSVQAEETGYNAIYKPILVLIDRD